MRDRRHHSQRTSAAIKASGFDVRCHGWRSVKRYRLSGDEERSHIAKAVASCGRPSARGRRGGTAATGRA